MIEIGPRLIEELAPEQLVRLDLVQRLLVTPGVPVFQVADHAATLADFVLYGPPGLAPSGQLFLVPHGAPVEFSMSAIPNDKDAIQRLTAGDYDGPVRGTAVGGDLDVSTVSVTPETTDGLAQRISGPVGAIGTVEVEYSADKRHGGDTVETKITVTYEFVAPDAPNLQTADVEIVDKAA